MIKIKNFVLLIFIGLFFFVAACERGDDRSENNKFAEEQESVAINPPPLPGPEFDLLATPVGVVNFPNGCVGEAAAMVERGVALMHHMMYEEADFVFTMAMNEDPECALSYWGQAMTIIHPLWPDQPSPSELERGLSLVEKSLSLGGHDAREDAYLQTAAAYFVDGAEMNEKERLKKSELAWDVVSNENPDDLEARAFYALSLIATADNEDPDLIQQQEAGLMAEGILDENPDHPGAHHYVIHAYDFPALAARAEDTADNYGIITPRVPHATHMMTHTYTRLGKWQKAIDWNRISAETALALCISTGEVNIHYTHALDYLAYAYLQKGDDEKVREVLTSAEELKPPYSPVNHVASAYAFSALPARYALERHDWVEAARLRPRVPNDFPWEESHEPYVAITHFARALGHARSGNPELATGDIETLTEMRDRIQTYSDYWAKQVEIQRLSAYAWQLYVAGAKEMGLDTMKTAADLEATTEKNAVTPGEVLPAAELYGDMLADAGMHGQALEAYRVALKRSPGRYNSLRGAGMAAIQVGDEVAARVYFAELMENAGDNEDERGSLSQMRLIMARL